MITPTLLAGDRSLATVVAHEVSHSWTGNLVTNATWEHFWLNEGWTVWLERKITSRLRGHEWCAAPHAAPPRRTRRAEMRAQRRRVANRNRCCFRAFRYEFMANEALTPLAEAIKQCARRAELTLP